MPPKKSLVAVSSRPSKLSKPSRPAAASSSSKSSSRSVQPTGKPEKRKRQQEIEEEPEEQEEIEQSVEEESEQEEEEQQDQVEQDQEQEEEEEEEEESGDEIEQEEEEEEEEDGEEEAQDGGDSDDDLFDIDGPGDEEDGDGEKKSTKVIDIAQELDNFDDAYKKRGVVYVGYIPPTLTALKLRHLLSQHATVLRIFLREEDHNSRSRRTAKGGNGSKRYLDGWVEFAKKKEAKYVASCLNNQPIGGNRRDPLYSKLWNLKYLPGFKWHHLTDKITYDERMRTLRMRREIAEAHSANREYARQVRQSKKMKKEPAAAADDDDGEEEKEDKNSKKKANNAPVSGATDTIKQIRMMFRQRQAKADPVDAMKSVDANLMAKIFPARAKQ